MSDLLTGVLIELRAKAHAHEGEWIRRGLQRGLRLAWRTTAVESVDEFALSREDQMPSEQEVRTCVEHLDEALAPTARRSIPDRHTLILAVERRSCDQCDYSLDIDAKLACSLLCSVCQRPSKTRCRACGAETTTARADFIGFCSPCAAERRASHIKNARRMSGTAPAEATQCNE